MQAGARWAHLHRSSARGRPSPGFTAGAGQETGTSSALRGKARSEAPETSGVEDEGVAHGPASGPRRGPRPRGHSRPKSKNAYRGSKHLALDCAPPPRTSLTTQGLHIRGMCGYGAVALSCSCEARGPTACHRISIVAAQGGDCQVWPRDGPPIRSTTVTILNHCPWGSRHAWGKT